MASEPSSPVLILIAWSIFETKIFPSPIFPVFEDLIISSMDRAIGAKKVTYDFERMMDNADLVTSSGFADEMIKRM